MLALCNSISMENTPLSDREFSIAVATRDLIALRRSTTPSIDRVLVVGLEASKLPHTTERTVVSIADWAETPGSLSPSDVELQCDRCGRRQTLGDGERIHHCACLSQVHCPRCAAELSGTPPRQRRSATHDCHSRIFQMGALIQRLGSSSDCFPYTHIVDESGWRTTTLPICSALAYGGHLASSVTVGMSRDDIELVVRETALMNALLREIVVLSPRCETCDRRSRSR
jgi:hypothetical protein